jgi:antitoxin VapB
MVGMSLNIKNERTHELVRQLATLTGMSQTDAVTDAVQRRLAELQATDDAEWAVRKAEILRLAAEIREGTTDVDWSTDDLYDDETGLPR